MNARVGLPFALIGLGLAGCATFVEGTHQNIAIATPPTQSAYCVLTRPGGRWSATTPGVVWIEKSMDDLAISCSRPGYQDTHGTIPSEIEGWTLGNLAFGAMPAGIDAATGAMFRYPDTFEMPMAPGRTSAEGPLVGPGATALPYIAPTPLPSLPPRQEAAPPTPPLTTPKQPLPGTLPDNF
jgi:hypothetical protein